jgi:hypothetical protein
MAEDYEDLLGIGDDWPFAAQAAAAYEIHLIHFRE